MNESEHPIVKAVLKDPVVKAATETERRSGSVSVTTAEGHIVAAPTTTAEQDRGTEGQRHVNLMWEGTQRLIALSVIFVALTVAAWLAVTSETDTKTAASVFLYGVANLVIGFYFGRTNHARVGGIQNEHR